MGILKVTHSYSVLTVGASQIDKCSQLQGEIHGNTWNLQRECVTFQTWHILPSLIKNTLDFFNYV